MFVYRIYDGSLLDRLGFQAKCVVNGSPERQSVWQIFPMEQATVRLNGRKIVAVAIDGRNLVRFPASNFDSKFAVEVGKEIGGYYGFYPYLPIPPECAPDMNPVWDRELPIKNIRLVNWPMSVEFDIQEHTCSWSANDYCKSLNNVGMMRDAGILPFSIKLSA